MCTYLALLRGINVGKNSTVPMARLREVFAELGCADVRTYIQSGNVVFRFDDDPHELRSHLATAINDSFGLAVPVLLRDRTELDAVVRDYPFADRDLDPSKVGVGFLAHETTDDIDLRPSRGKEEIVRAGRELYIHYPDGMGRSALTPAFFQRRLPNNPMTVRNWRTVMRLHTMMYT
ncbi:MAG TPA: DUF1697 domain-containing protein [Candidatus Stackebrandtia faecavium]|nr:DUF1697 domain-containing protein [Candidatus Stackebrandtia faecavium]